MTVVMVVCGTGRMQGGGGLEGGGSVMASDRLRFVVRCDS